MLSQISTMEPVSLPNKNKFSNTFTTSDYDDIEITSATKSDLLTMRSVLQQLNVNKHSVTGDGSCLYHAIAHQAGFINRSSTGETIVSESFKTNSFQDDGRTSCCSLGRWPVNSTVATKETKTLNPYQWDGDLEVQLLAIGLKRDIVVLTVTQDGSTYVHT